MRICNLEQTIKRSAILASILALTLLVISDAALADIVITQRDSYGRVGVFAGSGGALDQSESVDSLGASTGMFNFSDSLFASVTEQDPFSNGAAEASGSISIHDNVVQSSASSLTLMANRSSNGSAQHFSGTGNATTSQNQEFRVRFEVTDRPARYTLSGFFNPGDLNGTHSIRLHRPFTANQKFFIDSPGILNETGLLDAGKTYEFRLLLNDMFSANAGNPGPDFGSSDFNLLFTVSSVPEPGMGLLSMLAMTGALLIGRRRR